jgi:hypothetical protein
MRRQQLAAHEFTDRNAPIQFKKLAKNDFRDAEAIAEAVQRPTMKFVATKTADQLDLQALHRVRERLVGQRTGVINQIRAFQNLYEVPKRKPVMRLGYQALIGVIVIASSGSVFGL